MIEQILKGKNIRSACKQVMSNKGSAGVDGITVMELPQYLKLNQKDLCRSIRSDLYFAQPIMGVEIPKENDQKRLLGIPTVVDRLLQQAVHQIISPMFEVEFTDYSYGFRPHRNAHHAIMQAQKNIHEGMITL